MATKAEKRRKRRSNQKRTAENDNTSSNGVTKIGSTNDLRHDGDHDQVTKSSYDETSCSVSANGTTKTESRSNDSSSIVRMEQKSVRGVDTGRSAGSASEVQVQVGGKRGGRKRPREGLSSPHSAIPPTETPQITTGKRKHTPGGKMPKTNAEKAVGTAVRGHAAGKGSASSAVGNGAKGGAGARDVVRNAAAPRLSELQQRMRQKLEGAQFRMINETLYTSESKTALAKFQEEPELFDVYHRGFREQVEKWPVHPLDIIIQWLGKYPKARIADFGCGEARLAATVPNKVYSFDLVSPNPRVTACDMANVPIKDSSVHVAVFCLSLMGTNLADFLREAHRVLVPGGLVKVAEVRSRFEGEEGGVERFLEVTKRLGFDRRQVDRSNKMFLLAEFKKSARRPEQNVDFEAKACVYKRR